jgi:hypothetical protein
MYISRKAFLFTLVSIIAAVALLTVLTTARQVRMNRGVGFGVNESVAPAFPSAGTARDDGKLLVTDVTSSYMPMPPVYPGGESVRGGELYIQDTSLSLVSGNPLQTESEVRRITQELGGFLVSSNMTRPEEGATANVIVRVPTDRLDEALQKFEEAGERVVSKSILGRDVTEQYQDIESRLETLETVEARLQELLARTTEASTLLQIQQQLFQIQDQKDALVGQQQYLEDAAAMTRVTIYVASDEQALPYVPAQPWKPDAIFKQAVRSLVGTVRGIASAGIWIVVYLPLFIPFVLIGWVIARRARR